jgi:hypothetical protein
MVIRTILFAAALAAAATAGVQAQAAQGQSRNNLKQLVLAYGDSGQALRIADAQNAPDAPLNTIWSDPPALAAVAVEYLVLMTYAQEPATPRRPGRTITRGSGPGLADHDHDSGIDILSIDFTSTGVAVTGTQRAPRTPRRAGIEDARHNLQLGALATQTDPRTSEDRLVLILLNGSDRAWSGALNVRVHTSAARTGSGMATGRRTYEPMRPSAADGHDEEIDILSWNWGRAQIPAGGAIALPVPVSSMREIITLHIGQGG